MTRGKLYLIPNIIADGTQNDVILPGVQEIIKGLRYFLAEDARTARRFFGSLKVFTNLEEIHFDQLNKDTPDKDLAELLEPLLRGLDMGIISEAGCPGIADPGALAVAYAHAHHIKVIPLVGPSSLLLALMASGLNGQHFAFHGYLPIDQKEASKAIKEFERESRQRNQTQIFIETPYRNARLLETLLNHLHHETRLCVAVNLTAPDSQIISQSVREWKAAKESLPKEPAVFLFLA